MPAPDLSRALPVPWARLDAPHALVAAIVVVAESDVEAERLAMPTALQRSGGCDRIYGLYPTLEDADVTTPADRAFVADWLGKNIVRCTATVKESSVDCSRRRAPICSWVLCTVPELKARLRSYELFRQPTPSKLC